MGTRTRKREEQKQQQKNAKEEQQFDSDKLHWTDVRVWCVAGHLLLQSSSHLLLTNLPLDFCMVTFLPQGVVNLVFVFGWKDFLRMEGIFLVKSKPFPDVAGLCEVFSWQKSIAPFALVLHMLCLFAWMIFALNVPIKHLLTECISQNVSLSLIQIIR